MSKRLWKNMISLAAFAGCATANPPQELVDARSAYSQASQGPAQQYKPDELHEARVKLDDAEQAFKDDPGGEKTKTLAYVAERNAQLADTDGAIARAYSDKQAASDKLTQVATSDLQATRGQLNQTREQLATETQARQDAERRAKEALDKLSLASVPVKQETRGTVITLPGNVLFASGKSMLLPTAQQKLQLVAQALKDDTDRQIKVEGYTDSRGNQELNQSLSQERAQSVRSYLVAQGIPDDHINAAGMGPANPVADNSTAEGRADNRRVEIVVSPPAEPK